MKKKSRNREIPGLSQGSQLLPVQVANLCG